jgi:type IV pilus assembly protein PilV
MVEVMVALIVVSVGLLGVAKIQALALATTATAKTRSLASIEAASLASTMHADRAYWGSLPRAHFSVSIESNGRVTSTQDSTLNSTKAARPPRCTAIPPDDPCSAAAIAALDLGDWADSLSAVLPNVSALIACDQAVTARNPRSCRITLQWAQPVVAAKTAGNANQNITPSPYVLYVDL